MQNIKIAVLLTCYNRKEKTKNAIEKISKSELNIDFLVVDDGSTDGTIESIKDIKNVEILTGDGNLYYSGGMRKGMEYLINNKKEYDYLLIINDDVEFFDNFLEKMIKYSENKQCVVIGSTIDDMGNLSYGGIKYKSRFSSKYDKYGPDYIGECDTFNANCVLIPYNYFKKCGTIDKHYIHAIGDFDYGFQLKRQGYKLYIFSEYIGVCNGNSIANTWRDKNLSISERLRKKRQIKGLPFKPYFYYFYKNFNILLAIKCSITPYIRILMKK